MPSLQSSLITGLLRLLRRKRIYGSAEAIRQGIEAVRRAGPARPTSRMRRTLDVQSLYCNGLEVYRLAPKSPRPQGGTLLYLHGGAYVRPITSHHWRFLQTLVEASGFTLLVPLYPLAPEACCLQSVAAVAAVYRQACEEAGRGPLALMGDSAGGGLALALWQELPRHGMRRPDSLVLNCPWVDVAMTHPDIPRVEPLDPMLAVDGLREAGRLYAGAAGVDHPLVSPLHGNLAGLPPLLLFVGSRDIACPDALLFAEKARQAGASVDLQVGDGLIHVWPILPIPEARTARDAIVRHLHQHGARD